MTIWLPGASVIDMSNSRGNGPFSTFLGVILHVNVSGKGNNGTSIDYFRNNPDQVCPNFQVYKDGSIVQFLPLNWQPWCQIDGNFNYGAIETGGDPDEALTDAQLASCAKIVRAYHDEMGMLYAVADQPGQKGIGTHQMGGISWGGHACPGTIRAGQRGRILDLARSGSTDPLGEIMSWYANKAEFEQAIADAVLNRKVTAKDGTEATVAHFIAQGEIHSRDADAQTTPAAPAKGGKQS